MTTMVNAIEQALIDLPGGPHIFQRSRQLRMVARGRKSPQWLQRPPDAPVIVAADPVTLRELANQAADWFKFDRRAKNWLPALPPEWTINTLCKRLAWKFPRP